MGTRGKLQLGCLASARRKFSVRTQPKKTESQARLCLSRMQRKSLRDGGTGGNSLVSTQHPQIPVPCFKPPGACQVVASPLQNPHLTLPNHPALRYMAVSCTSNKQLEFGVGVGISHRACFHKELTLKTFFSLHLKKKNVCRVGLRKIFHSRWNFSDFEMYLPQGVHKELQRRNEISLPRQELWMQWCISLGNPSFSTVLLTPDADGQGLN